MRLVSVCLICWPDAFFFVQRRTALKLCAWKLRTAISKPSSRLWRWKKHALALQSLGQGVWGSAFNDSQNQVPRAWSWHSCTSPGPTEFAHSKISGNIMPIVISEHMAPSSCVRTKQTRPVHSAHEGLNVEKKQIGLRRSSAPAGRKVCKWTVVKVERQAAQCRQIGSFPWWRWQTILKTARLWTPATSSSVWCRIKLNFFALESWRVPLFNSIIFIGKSWG